MLRARTGLATSSLTTDPAGESNGRSVVRFAASRTARIDECYQNNQSHRAASQRSGTCAFIVRIYAFRYTKQAQPLSRIMISRAYFAK